MSGDTLTIGVDIGGTATRIAAIVAGIPGASITVGTPTVRAEALPTLISRIDEVLRAPESAKHPLIGIGIGASGPITPAGIIDNPESLPALSGWDLVGGLRDRFGVPTRIDNDAVTAALGEVTALGADPSRHSILVITLGTGVGVAVVRDGRPFRGGDGEHPEAGHLTVPTESGPCYCGRSRCLEQSASRSTLQRLAQESIGEADLDALKRAAEEGDRPALETFSEYGRRVGEGLVELSTQHRPALVVLGGSASAYLPLFRPALEATVRSVPAAAIPRVAMTRLGDLGGAIGAARLLEL